MLKHYTHLAVIETSAYDTESFIEETRQIADELNLKHQLIPGDLTLLQKALQADWTNNFALIRPGQKITLHNMNACKNYFDLIESKNKIVPPADQ